MSLWNGNRGALSLTFDDALQCQLEFAVPVMNAFDIQGTFFAIGDCPQYPLDVHGWRKVLPLGHEIGSHSVRHRKAATLSAADALYETVESKRILENHFDVTVDSFCYPYTDAPGVIQDAVRRVYKQARGGRGARVDKYVVPNDGVNFFNLPCFHVDNSCFERGEVFPWIAEALARGAWLTLMFHGVGTDGNQWDNVWPEAWLSFMQHLQKQKENGLWVAPLGTVAENLRSNQ
jgi:peptidoglycan/xylan/chitin deacetylase (PgdA/CDA1 family)